MSAYLVAALAGLGAGAAIALLASGLVLTHLGSGVVNFAHGGIAAWAAYVYWDLFERGRYPLPFPGLPARIDIGARLTFASALVISLITAAVLGLVTYLLIFRLLRNASALAMVVATVGVLLVILSLIGIRFRDVGTPTVGPILPNENLGTGRYGLPQAGYWLAAIAVVVGAALWLVMRGTRFGLATLAAAESEKGAVLIGISPARQAAVAWLVSALLAGLTGVLFAPLVGQLSPILFVQYSVPALGAALLARFRSFPVAIAAGLVIGVIRSVIPELQRDWSWIPRAGAQEGLVFVAVIIAMVISGHRLPNRGAVITAMPPMPRVQMPARTVVLLAIAVGAVFTVLDDSWRLALLTTVIASVLALSLVVITGFVGQIALSQLAFAGIAAFSLARISSAWGLGFPWAPLLASLIATAAGVIVGIPALRVRGVNLAIVTLAGGVAVQEFVFKNREFVGDTSTGGATVANPSLFGYDLGLTRPGELFRLEFCLLATVVAALLALAVTNLRAGTTGRRMLAVRDNERAASAVGISVARTKLLAFAVASFIAGIGGTLLAYRFTTVSDQSFGTLASLGVVAYAFLGGITSVRGALIAGLIASDGFVVKITNELLDATPLEIGKWQVVLTAIGLVATVVTNPNGLAGMGTGRALSLRRLRSA